MAKLPRDKFGRYLSRKSKRGKRKTGTIKRRRRRRRRRGRRRRRRGNMKMVHRRRRRRRGRSSHKKCVLGKSLIIHARKKLNDSD